MLYDEKIEALISAALADGVLTEKEKQILFKKAQAQGIDLDEFEMVLDARLVEIEKAEKEKAAAAAPKSTKYGDVRKCPVCGAMVPALATSCPECGYEFSGVEASSSSQKLAQQIDEILQEVAAQKKELQMSGKFSDKVEKGETWSPIEKVLRQTEKDGDKRIEETIKNFSIPNAKTDLFEFITSLQAKVKGKYGDAYTQKLNEAFIKAKALFPNDSLFASIFTTHETKKKNRARKKLRNKLILNVIGILLSALVVYLEWHFIEWHWGWKLLLVVNTAILPYAIVTSHIGPDGEVYF